VLYARRLWLAFVALKGWLDFDFFEKKAEHGVLLAKQVTYIMIEELTARA
jgi:hypothetical protein